MAFWLVLGGFGTVAPYLYLTFAFVAVLVVPYRTRIPIAAFYLFTFGVLVSLEMSALFPVLFQPRTFSLTFAPPSAVLAATAICLMVVYL